MKEFDYLRSTVTTGLAIGNSYMRAADSEGRGEWAFRGGESVPLGSEPELCKDEALRERPRPFYVESDLAEESKEAHGA